eukprot:11679925-Alexandrium_andersonii.AAC.1
MCIRDSRWPVPGPPRAARQPLHLRPPRAALRLRIPGQPRWRCALEAVDRFVQNIGHEPQDLLK